jgi:hypothetical protein
MVNTFTEHHGGAWSVKDMQHTYVSSDNCLSKRDQPICRVLGVLWWAGGALGIFLSRNNQVCMHVALVDRYAYPSMQRNVLPGMMFVFRSPY